MCNMPSSLVDKVLHNLTSSTSSPDRSVFRSGVGLRGPTVVRATVQSVTDVSVFSSPACNSSPVTFYLQKKRKRNGEGNVQSKKQHTVSWKDTESCSTTATDATQCSINEKNTCHICKLVGGQFVHIVKRKFI